MVAKTDPGIVSVITYLGGPSEPYVDPSELYGRLIHKYEELTGIRVFAANPLDLEQTIFSTVLDVFLKDYRRITDVKVIVEDFGAFVSQRIDQLRGRLTRSSLINFFSQYVGGIESAGSSKEYRILFGPSSSFSLPNFLSALQNETFDNYQLEDLVSIQRLILDPHIRFMGPGLLSMIDWETTDDQIVPIYPERFEIMVIQASELNSHAWREALKAILSATDVDGQPRFFNDRNKLVSGEAEPDLFMLVGQVYANYVNDKEIVIPESADEIEEMRIRHLDYLSAGGFLPVGKHLLLDDWLDTRDRSLLVLMEDGLVEEAKLLFKLRISAGESPAIGLLIHAAAAHGKLSGLRKMLFEAVIKAISPTDDFTHGKAMLMDEMAIHRLEEVFYYLMPFADFDAEEEKMMAEVMDMNAYLVDYYQRKPHRRIVSNGLSGPSSASGTSAPRTSGSTPPFGGADASASTAPESSFTETAVVSAQAVSDLTYVNQLPAGAFNYSATMPVMAVNPFVMAPALPVATIA